MWSDGADILSMDLCFFSTHSLCLSRLLFISLKSIRFSVSPGLVRESHHDFARMESGKHPYSPSSTGTSDARMTSSYRPSRLRLLPLTLDLGEEQNTAIDVLFVLTVAVCLYTASCAI